MAQRTNADMGLVDGMTSDLGVPRTAALLDRLEAAVLRDALAKLIEALPEYRAPRRGELNKSGRPAWPVSSEIFEMPAEAKYPVDRCRLHYSHRRPPRALGKKTPAEYAAACPAAPPLRLDALACAEAPPVTDEATSMLTFSQAVDR